jgi:hypothetical protein
MGAHIRRLLPDWAARPALLSRAAHAVESKAVVRIEVAVSPRPCLGCAVELVCTIIFNSPGSADSATEPRPWLLARGIPAGAVGYWIYAQRGNDRPSGLDAYIAH